MLVRRTIIVGGGCRLNAALASSTTNNWTLSHFGTCCNPGKFLLRSCGPSTESSEDSSPVSYHLPPETGSYIVRLAPLATLYHLNVTSDISFRYWITYQGPSPYAREWRATEPPPFFSGSSSIYLRYDTTSKDLTVAVTGPNEIYERICSVLSVSKTSAPQVDPFTLVAVSCRRRLMVWKDTPGDGGTRAMYRSVKRFHSFQMPAAQGNTRGRPHIRCQQDQSTLHA